MWQFLTPKKYRPGIDELPPTFIDWLLKASGLKWAFGSAVAWLKRRRHD